jgi:hypothetical protein
VLGIESVDPAEEMRSVTRVIHGELPTFCATGASSETPNRFS